MFILFQLYCRLFNIEQIFNNHCKIYDCDLNELNYHHRLKNFKNNFKLIKEHNKNNNSFNLKLNKYSHLSNYEYKKLLGFNNLNLNSQYDCENMNYKILFTNIKYDEDNFNWVEQNKITSVKNQLQCGSCWAFSTIGAYENWYVNNYNDLIDFSEQELVDCDNTDNGCNGGLMSNGFNYIKNNGICKYDNYSYNGKVSWFCKNYCTKYPKLNGCYKVPSNNIDMLKNAVRQNAVSIAIEADSSYFQHYSSGILDDKLKCGDNLDHGVLLVGFGIENNKKYWLVKNSWGKDWGDNGYIKIAMDNNNVCGVLSMPTYPY